jgi:hypothetical protein
VDNNRLAFAANNVVTNHVVVNYEFEEVPAERVTLSADGFTKIQPRQSFDLTVSFAPFWTTTTDVFYDVYPLDAASVSAKGRVTVSNDAIVGSTFTIVATADDSVGVISQPLEFLVEKIPVTGLEITEIGNDLLLHLGKARNVVATVYPEFASYKDVRYSISGTGLEYIESFNQATGEVVAKSDVSQLNANATVVVTGYALDNENFYDSVTYQLYIPSTVVEIEAQTPLGILSPEGKPLAVSSSSYSDIIALKTTVNGVETSGLNYVIVSGQSYIQDGYIFTDGTFKLRTLITQPDAEIKIKVAYSDGYAEVAISIYVPVESISFAQPMPTSVENYRKYDLQAKAYPSYATYLAGNTTPLNYSLNGISEDIATVGLTDGLLSLTKSTVSFGQTINLTAYLPNALVGVDYQSIGHSMNIVPVYATSFESVSILKNGNAIDVVNNKVMPSDVLAVVASYDKDNVTHLSFALSCSSNMLSIVDLNITIANLSAMESDNPEITLTVSYNQGYSNFNITRRILIYVPALEASLDGYLISRETTRDLKSGLIINTHNYASNHSITWDANPTIQTVDGQTGIAGSVSQNGVLSVTSSAHAGTKVTVRYKTYDNSEWQSKVYEIAPLAGIFSITYSKTLSSTDGRQYEIDIASPQLEDGQSVDVILKYNGIGAYTKLGVTFTLKCTSNATLVTRGHSASQDEFRLSALLGQSGRENYIKYTIEILDGTSKYSVETDGSTANPVSIWNRISGNIDVTNTNIEVGGTFILINWDSIATFNQSDLSWSLTNNGTLSASHAITKGPNSGFILKIRADQIYNGSNISWSKEITYIGITYRDDNLVLWKTSYMRSGSSIKLESSHFEKAGYTHTAWLSGASGTTKYQFSSTYSGTSDMTLYPSWTPITYYVQFYYIRDDARYLPVEFNDGTTGDVSVTCLYGQTYRIKDYNVRGGTFSHWEINGVLYSNGSEATNTEEPWYRNLTTTNKATVTFVGYVDWSCIASGTYITLADGSQKAVENLDGSELLLVWNLHTGSFDTAPILFIDSHGLNKYEIIKLSFSDGTFVDVIAEHGFWDFDLNKYVFLGYNALEYIGHWFNKQIIDNKGDLAWIKVQLMSVKIETKHTIAWSPVTFGHLCYYVNGMLSMPAETEGFINIFDVDPQAMQYDHDAYLADINEYGLFTYEDFESILPEAMFEAFAGQHLKVAMGEGLIDWTTIHSLVRRYSKFLQ